jgi:hypothetical protein
MVCHGSQVRLWGVGIRSVARGENRGESKLPFYNSRWRPTTTSPLIGPENAAETPWPDQETTRPTFQPPEMWTAQYGRCRIRQRRLCFPTSLLGACPHDPIFREKSTRSHHGTVSLMGWAVVGGRRNANLRLRQDGRRHAARACRALRPGNGANRLADRAEGRDLRANRLLNGTVSIRRGALRERHRAIRIQSRTYRFLYRANRLHRNRAGRLHGRALGVDRRAGRVRRGALGQHNWTLRLSGRATSVSRRALRAHHRASGLGFRADRPLGGALSRRRRAKRPDGWPLSKRPRRPLILDARAGIQGSSNLR